MALAPTTFRERLIGLLLMACMAVVCLLVSACEKDDICVDGDTPLLVITFYDYTVPESL